MFNAQAKYYTMNLENIITIDELFALWREIRKFESFSDDGILVEDLWKQARPKIAFLLKESNDDFCKIRGRSWGHPGEGNSRLFWRNLRMWTYITTELLNGRVCTLERTIAEKEKPLAEVAYINVKKKAESKPVSYDPDIQHHLDEDWDFLNRQIEIIAPDVLFCCGTFKYLGGKIELEQISKRIYYHRHLLVVDFYHPSARRGYKSNFDLLHEMLSLIPEKHKQRIQRDIQP
jgi:hypothetical protein